LKSFSKYFLLASYWAFLTKSLLMTQPWEIFSSRLAENPPIDLSFEPFSWIAHLSAYGILGALINGASGKRHKIHRVLFVLAFLHSGLCEYLQGMVPNRWPNLWDVFSNTFGLMSAYALHKILKRRTKALPDPSLKTSPKKQAA